jgi:hypothetical protein
MDDSQLPERTIGDAREIAADLRYRWNQAKATGDAEALARVHQLAKEAGVPPEQLDQITEGFVAIAQGLFASHGKKRRRNPFRWRRRRPITAAAPLNPPERRRELPPGDPS